MEAMIQCYHIGTWCRNFLHQVNSFITFIKSWCFRGAARGGRGRGARGRGTGRNVPKADKSSLDNELDAYMAAANIDDELLM